MNGYRKNIVMKAFSKLDKDASGVISVEDLKEVYNVTRHPDIVAKKKLEEDVLAEFLDTFEQHYAYLVYMHEIV